MNGNNKSTSKDNSNQYAWRCTVCGYVYDGDPLPSHYICPTCSSPAPKFERLNISELDR